MNIFSHGNMFIFSMHYLTMKNKFRHMKKLTGILIMLVVYTTTVIGQTDETINILFLGNSYTYYNGLPSLFSDMALQKGKKVVVTQITRGGSLLSKYAKTDYIIETIDKYKFNYVVLQEQSTSPLFAAEEKTYPAIRKLDKVIRKNGGQTVLYMTWAREYADSLGTKMLPGKFYYDVFDSFNEAQDSLAASYCKIGKEINAKVAPAGLAWKEFHKQYPEVSLWRPDHSHPLEIGSIIAAYTIYKTIFNESIKDIKCPLPLPKEYVKEIKNITNKLVPDTN